MAAASTGASIDKLLHTVCSTVSQVLMNTGGQPSATGSSKKHLNVYNNPLWAEPRTPKVQGM